MKILQEATRWVWANNLAVICIRSGVLTLEIGIWIDSRRASHHIYTVMPGGVGAWPWWNVLPMVSFDTHLLNPMPTGR
jgi:hypothetical protein